MAQLELRQSSQVLTSRAGLVLVGRALERFAGLTRAVDPRFPVRTGIPTSDLLKSYLGLPCESKSDFDAIEGRRGDRAFALALSGDRLAIVNAQTEAELVALPSSRRLLRPGCPNHA